MTATASQTGLLPGLTGTPWERLEVDLRRKTMPAVLAEAVRTWPGRPVIDFYDQPGSPALTYQEFGDQVARAAGLVRDLGVGPGDRIGVLLPNVIEFPVLWLGITAAGAVVVPIAAQSAGREIAFIAADTQMSALVVDAEAQDRIADLPSTFVVPADRVVVVGAGEQPLRRPSWRHYRDLAAAAEPLDLDAAPVEPDDLASIQFTSGTTGLPKGCMLSHEYWTVIGETCAALVERGVRHYLADAPWHYMSNHSYLMSALLQGAQLHCGDRLSLSRFSRRLREQAIDFSWLEDVMLRTPVEDSDATSALRLVPSDGIDPTLHAALEERYGCTVREWYASTEVGMGTVSPFWDAGAVGSGTMGYPAPWRETKLVDADGRDVALPGQGELCVRGIGVLSGYWNRPDANAELFLDGGWFRTGDIARVDEQQLHTYVGRVKDMIRRSGENVSAVEVEQQIATHPSVDEVAVLGVPDDLRGEEVKAVLTLRAGVSALDPVELQAWCSARLSAFKVPRFVEVRSELPHTGSGKIAKGALRAEPDQRAGCYDLREGRQL